MMGRRAFFKEQSFPSCKAHSYI